MKLELENETTEAGVVTERWSDDDLRAATSALLSLELLRRRAVELGYDVTHVDNELLSLRHELARHGLSYGGGRDVLA